MIDWNRVFDRLHRRIETYGIRVTLEEMGWETTGTFEGLSVSTNVKYDVETRCHNMAHSLGHIVQWSLDTAKHQDLYQRLYAAKARQADDPQTLEERLQEFREYEEQASEYAVWLLADIDCAEALPTFTNFARADIECIVAFHRAGIAPVWRDFLARWSEGVARGEILLRPFAPRPIPPFTPVSFAEQEIVRGVDKSYRSTARS